MLFIWFSMVWLFLYFYSFLLLILKLWEDLSIVFLFFVANVFYFETGLQMAEPKTSNDLFCIMFQIPIVMSIDFSGFLCLLD
jgi:hypothetical protein